MPQQAPIDFLIGAIREDLAMGKGNRVYEYHLWVRCNSTTAVDWA